MKKQSKEWRDGFGDEYTRRNFRPLKALDELYEANIGISRSSINSDFLDFLSRDSSILEVGTNIGNQLLLLFQMGFADLSGIEINPYAIRQFYNQHMDLSIKLTRASAFALPFKNNCFDGVFTSCVLIHIHPNNINLVMSEMYRCSKKYIWGYEFFSEDYQGVEYRSKTNMCWKANFKQLFLDNFPDLRLVKGKIFPRIEAPHLEDQFYLLEKI